MVPAATCRHFSPFAQGSWRQMAAAVSYPNAAMMANPAMATSVDTDSAEETYVR